MKWRKALLFVTIATLVWLSLLTTVAAQVDIEVPTDLQGLLGWIVTGGGAVLIAYWVIEHWPWWPRFSEWQPEPKRWAAMAWVFVATAPAVLLQVWFGLRQMPPNIQAWLNIMFTAWGPLFLANQLWHGRAKAFWDKRGR